MPPRAHTHRYDRYKVNGKVVPSVTTILSKFKDPGPLMYWSWNTAYEPLEQAVHLLEKTANGSNRLRTAIECDQFLISKPLEKGDYRSEAREAANAGTAAHKLVDMWIKNNKDTRRSLESITSKGLQARERINKEVADKALSSFKAFLAWAKQTRFTMEESECRLVSEQHNFGGTIDCLGSVLGEDGWVLLDWKTSKGLYADYILQIAAYGILWEENWSPAISSYHLLRFDKVTGDFSHKQFASLDDEKRMFLLLRECYDILKQIEKRVK